MCSLTVDHLRGSSSLRDTRACPAGLETSTRSVPCLVLFLSLCDVNGEKPAGATHGPLVTVCCAVANAPQKGNGGQFGFPDDVVTRTLYPIQTLRRGRFTMRSGAGSPAGGALEREAGGPAGAGSWAPGGARGPAGAGSWALGGTGGPAGAGTVQAASFPRERGCQTRCGHSHLGIWQKIPSKQTKWARDYREDS